MNVFITTTSTAHASMVKASTTVAPEGCLSLAPATKSLRDRTTHQKEEHYHRKRDKNPEGH